MCVCVWVCVRGCSQRLRQEWPRQGSSCNLQPTFIVQQCRGRRLASLRTTPLSRCYSRIPSSPPLSTSTQCHHHTIAPNWPLHQYWSSAAPGDRSISQTFQLAQPMVQWSAGLPLRWLPPPSKLARYALQMRLFVGYSGTTLGRRGPPSGCCHSFPSGQFWLRETRGGGKVAQVQRKTCPVVARIRIRIRIAFAPPHDCRSPQFNATQAEGGRMDSPGGKDSL